MSEQTANTEALDETLVEEHAEQPEEMAEGTTAEESAEAAEGTAQAAAEGASAEEEAAPQGAEVRPFPELGDDLEEAPEPNLDVILNIPVTLSMEVGRTRMTIRELMALKRGSVVKFNRLAGEPMDVLVNGTLIAHGEVVVINDKFGIRLIDVISPAERVRKLR